MLFRSFIQGACSTRCWGLSVLTPNKIGDGGNGLWGGGVGMFRDPVITVVTLPFPQRPFLWSSRVLTLPCILPRPALATALPKGLIQRKTLVCRECQ